MDIRTANSVLEYLIRDSGVSGLIHRHNFAFYIIVYLICKRFLYMFIPPKLTTFGAVTYP